jgi:YrbI family 3-deoxy-D-manno-octulosonate 8-phosphate phosphatase
MSSVLAIIPARGGSKGIPRKNVRPFLGKPLLVHSIDDARSAPSVTRVVVSTDDPEIARVAQDNEAEVVHRPTAISGDTATSESALIHVLDYLRDVKRYEPDLVVFLQATSPLRRPGAVQAAIETLEREGADSLFSACSAHGFIWRLHEGRLQSLTYDHRNRPRRQDIGEDLVENGSIYAFRPWVLRKHNNRLGGKIAVYRMDPFDSFQIDEPGDFERIEQLATLSSSHVSSPLKLAAVRLLVLDFDGVMTDNRVLVHQDGTEAVWCHRGDGWGIARLKERGVKIIVISTETNPVVEARCRKLGIDFVQACDDKLGALKRVVEQLGLSPDQVAYVGNDVNDLECMRWVGIPIGVADAVPEVQNVAQLVTDRTGGHGAVRQVADWIIGIDDRQRPTAELSRAVNRPAASGSQPAGTLRAPGAVKDQASISPDQHKFDLELDQRSFDA